MVIEEETDYREKIHMIIEMEKLKLVTCAIREGISEQDVDRVLQEENLPDYDLENLKLRLGIKK